MGVHEYRDRPGHFYIRTTTLGHGVATYQIHAVLQRFLRGLNPDKREEWWVALSDRGTSRFFRAGLLWVNESSGDGDGDAARSSHPEDFVWRVKVEWGAHARRLDPSRARVLEHEPRHVQLWERERWELRDADLLLPYDIECIPDFTPRGVQWVDLVPAVRSEGLELIIEANMPIPRLGDRLRVARTLWSVVEWSSEPEECRLGNDSGGTIHAARLPGVEDKLMPELLTYEGDAAIFVLEGEFAQSPGQQGHDMEPITVDALTIFTRGPFVVLRLKVRAQVMEWRVMAQSFELLDFHCEPDPVQLRVRLRSSMLFFLGGRTNDTQALRWNWGDGDSYGPQFANEPEFECTQMNREDVFAIYDALQQAIQVACTYCATPTRVPLPGVSRQV